MNRTDRPILVTGSHRSGSTWVGKSLALAPDTAYLREPFNPILKLPISDRVFTQWFYSATADNDALPRAVMDYVLTYRYPLVKNLLRSRSLGDLKHVAVNQRDAAMNRFKKPRPIVKDPIAFFSAEWMDRIYDMDVVVLIRHPAAFASSLKIKNWQLDFSGLLRQDALMRGYLAPYRAEIESQAAQPRDIIEQAILFWNIVHQTILDYQDRHPDWIFLRHEDLSRSPAKQFATLYGRLGLDFTHEAQAGIVETSGSHNPTEQTRDQFVRDSRTNIKNWRNRLADEEIHRVYEGTQRIAQAFYTTQDW